MSFSGDESCLEPTAFHGYAESWWKCVAVHILDSATATPLGWPKPTAPTRHRISMTLSEKTRAILTDSHFLIPLAVFFIGLALLIALH
jgi:hypothetical protein